MQFCSVTSTQRWCKRYVFQLSFFTLVSWYKNAHKNSKLSESRALENYGNNITGTNLVYNKSSGINYFPRRLYSYHLLHM